MSATPEALAAEQPVYRGMTSSQLREQINTNASTRRTRLGEMCEARAVLRRHQVKTPAELLDALNNVLGSFEAIVIDSRMQDFKQRLADLASDLEDEILSPGDSA